MKARDLRKAVKDTKGSIYVWVPALDQNVKVTKAAVLDAIKGVPQTTELGAEVDGKDLYIDN